MIVTTDITTPRTEPTAVALGLFDGLHLGHRAVISAMTQAAAQQALRPTVFTFLPYGTIPDGKAGLTLLQTEQQKQRLLSTLGVAETVSPPFEAFMKLSPAAFVETLLRGTLHAKVLVCGDNYRFGKAASAGVDELRALAAPLGIQVLTAPPVLLDGAMVSSSRIRKAIVDGQPELAEAMLGAPFTIEGTVVRGKQLGRTLHSPTVNLALPTAFTQPLHGVYLTRVQTTGGSYWGVTNIGTRPTVDGQGVNCETYLMNFTGELYGQEIAVAFQRLLRVERRFPDTAALANQIQLDIKKACEWIPKLCRQEN
ncbi:MAG: riboflavin biosynthesis protein RibF, partial [Angelakisella sp.]